MENKAAKKYLITIADLSLTPDNEIVIYELGHYSNSSDAGLLRHVHDGFADAALNYLNNQEPHCRAYFIHSLIESSSFFATGCRPAKNSIYGKAEFDKLFDNQNKPENLILTGHQKELEVIKAAYPAIRIEGSTSSSQLACKSKTFFYQIANNSTHIPYTKLLTLADLLNSYDLSDFNSQVIVKPTDASMGKGVFVTDKKYLKEIFFYLNKNKTILWEELAVFGISSAADKAAIEYWRKTISPSTLLLIQNIVPSKLIVQGQKKYKSTIRLLLGCCYDPHDNTTQVSVLTGYHKLPQATYNAANNYLTTEDTVSHIDSNNLNSTIILSKDEMLLLQEKINHFLPAIVNDIFTRSPEYYFQQTITHRLESKEYLAYFLYHFRYLLRMYPASISYQLVETIIDITMDNVELEESLLSFLYHTTFNLHSKTDELAYINHLAKSSRNIEVMRHLLDKYKCPYSLYDNIFLELVRPNPKRMNKIWSNIDLIERNLNPVYFKPIEDLYLLFITANRNIKKETIPSKLSNSPEEDRAYAEKKYNNIRKIQKFITIAANAVSISNKTSTSHILAILTTSFNNSLEKLTADALSGLLLMYFSIGIRILKEDKSLVRDKNLTQFTSLTEVLLGKIETIKEICSEGITTIDNITSEFITLLTATSITNNASYAELCKNIYLFGEAAQLSYVNEIKNYCLKYNIAIENPGFSPGLR